MTLCSRTLVHKYISVTRLNITGTQLESVKTAHVPVMFQLCSSRRVPAVVYLDPERSPVLVGS